MRHDLLGDAADTPMVRHLLSMHYPLAIKQLLDSGRVIHLGHTFRWVSLHQVGPETAQLIPLYPTPDLLLYMMSFYAASCAQQLL